LCGAVLYLDTELQGAISGEHIFRLKAEIAERYVTTRII
jgi:hypothetical protein